LPPVDAVELALLPPVEMSPERAVLVVLLLTVVVFELSLEEELVALPPLAEPSESPVLELPAPPTAVEEVLESFVLLTVVDASATAWPRSQKPPAIPTTASPFLTDRFICACPYGACVSSRGMK
jgi:hypothetical protein